MARTNEKVDGTATAPLISAYAVGEQELSNQRAVFLHGLFGRGRNFTSIAQALTPRIASLLVDLPNHGKSGWTEHFSYEETADSVATFLRNGFAKDAPVDLVGHSMGGKVAMVLALRHPELVRRLVVIDISPVAMETSKSSFPHLFQAMSEVDLTSVTRRDEVDTALLERVPEDSVRQFLMQNLRRVGGGFTWEPNLALLRRSLDTITGFPDLPGARFERPVLWIRGERSHYVSDSDGPAMRTLFPKTTRITIHGAGHWVHSEAPEETISALRAFLR